ncbi:MAG: SCO family protein [Bacteroidota bacterium]
MHKRFLFLLGSLSAALFLLLLSCVKNPDADGQLPILGNRTVENGDTVYHRIKDFSFVNQDSNIITNASFEDKIYITDFFFTSCPTICPKVKQQMLRIHDKFKDNDKVVLLSHSIDVRHDTVAVLKKFATKLEVDTDRWHFVTGDEDHIYDMADEYFIVAQKDPDAPGGFDHSGRIILVDQNRYVRGFANGVDAEDVDRFMGDIQKLLDETAIQ